MMIGDASAGPIYAGLCSARRCFILCSGLYALIGVMPFLVEDKTAKAGSPIMKLQRFLDALGRSTCGQCCGVNSHAARVGPAGAPAAAAAAGEPAEDGGGGGGDSSSVAAAAAPDDDARAVNGAGADHPTEPEKQAEVLDCKVQVKLIWQTIDPTGPTHGIILRAILYIVLCIAIIPDYYCESHVHPS
jgi:hypothetical protein